MLNYAEGLLRNSHARKQSIFIMSGQVLNNVVFESALLFSASKILQHVVVSWRMCSHFPSLTSMFQDSHAFSEIPG